VIATFGRLAAAGRAVLVVSHRPAVIAAADAVVDLGEPALSGAACRYGAELPTGVPA
jgi:excinuclease UvrABC ATPase subunit